QGPLSWQIVAVYPGGLGDYTNRPRATAMNRTLPDHAPAFLSKPAGKGSEAEAIAHYRRLFPRGEHQGCYNIYCVLLEFGVAENIAQGGWTDQAVGYTNRTELGATR